MAQENKGVWVFSDLPSLAFELLGKGRTLADQLATQLTAVSITATLDVNELVQRGADRVFSVSDPALTTFQVESYADVLTALVNEQKPDVLLIGATRNGLELAPRLAERLKTGCVTETTRLELDAEKKLVVMERVTYGGNLVETQVSKARPQIATIARGLFAPIPAESSRKGEIVKVEPKI